MARFFRRILFPSDLTPLSPELIRQIQEIAGNDLDELHMAFVLEAFHEIPTDFPLPGVSLEPVSQEAMVRLTRIARSLSLASGRLSAGVYTGRADQTLASLALSGDFDLILLVSHGRNLLGRLMVGSVSTSVMHISPIPVLIIKEPATREGLTKSLTTNNLGKNSLVPLAINTDIRQN